MTPLEHYQADLRCSNFEHDPAQETAVRHLDNLYGDLIERSRGKSGVWSRLFGANRPMEPVVGLYLWGGVGRGKTYLMDVFYESLPIERKMRLHFHRFMRRVHSDLKRFKGQKNPLDKVAEQIASEARVICFDEFFVTDITDAMILANMLRGLFERGVTLVATSNIVPDDLYRDGLQRGQFIPAINLLKKHTHVINVDGGVDYRLRALERVELYHCPWTTEARDIMNSSLRQLVPEATEIRRDTSIEIEGRFIGVIAVTEDVVWFDFQEICDGPRSQNDYIEIAREYHSVFISDIPQFKGQDDLARRFVNLVDEFYDRCVNLVLGARVPLDELYSSGQLQFEFQRTLSRLQEMQSVEYLARAHKP